MTENKRFYWIKLKADFFDLAAIDYLQGQANGCEYIVLYQKLCLITANSGGQLVSEIGEMLIPFDAAKIARDTKFSIDTVVVALELFKRLQLIYEQDNGILRIPYVEEITGSDTLGALEKQRQRREARQKTQIEIHEENYIDNSSADPKEKMSDKCPTNVRQMSDKILDIRDKSSEIKNLESESDISIGNNADDIVSLFNTICVSLQKVVKLTDKRNKQIAKMKKKYSLDDIKTVFEKAENSKFLTGQINDFRACFDWLINETNFIKVLEGNYDNYKKPEQKDDAKKASYDMQMIEQDSLDMYKDV
jgi:predicted phage replisome organizer